VYINIPLLVLPLTVIKKLPNTSQIIEGVSQHSRVPDQAAATLMEKHFGRNVTQ